MAYYDPDTGKYFAEIMYASRERRVEHDCEITRDMYCRLKTFGDDTDNERSIKTAKPDCLLSHNVGKVLTNTHGKNNRAVLYRAVFCKNQKNLDKSYRMRYNIIR